MFNCASKGMLYCLSSQATQDPGWKRFVISMSRVTLPLIITIALFIFPSDIFAANQTTPPLKQTELSLTQAINQLIAHELPNADIGIVIMNAQTGKLLYQRNAYQAFTPASNLKLFTAAAALLKLGPSYHFNTSILINHNQKQRHVLNGDLVVQFTGDPTLTAKNLKKLITGIKQKGIDQINGNIIIDDHDFSGPTYAPGWSMDDQHWYYAAPISAIIINQNAVAVSIGGSKTVGRPAVMRLNHASPYFHLTSNVTSVTYQKAERHCSIEPQVSTNNHIDFVGCWPVAKNAGFKIAIANPRLYATQLIRNSLKENNIHLSGKIVTGATPKNMQRLLVHQSPALKQMIHTMLKDSDNVYAESILKTLGKKVTGVGSFQQGANAMEHILHATTDIDFKQAEIVDGSGASRYDLVRPAQLARLLYVMANNQQLKSDFIRALPIAGEDGTLDKRMQAFDVKGKVHAKTGTLKGVTTLSGYIKTQDGKQLLFVMMMNHIVGKVQHARNIQAQIAAMLY